MIFLNGIQTTSRFLLLSLMLTTNQVSPKQECSPRFFDSDSFVCVCNATYCDTIDKWVKPDIGIVLVYTSSKAEFRFHEEQIPFQAGSTDCSTSPFDFEVSICIDSTHVKQEIVGFGGSFTDATGINIISLSEDVQQRLKEAYFSDNGLEYNIFRVPIGGSDFSTRAYSYDDFSSDDFQLSNFSLQMEDLQYKIPLIKEAQDMSSHSIKLVATCWSPPAWMKTSNSLYGLGWLKGSVGGQYYDTYAKYFIRFFQEYRNNGINFWGLTTQNEPVTGFIPFYPFNNNGFTPEMLKTFVKTNLGPQLRASEFNTTKLLIYDNDRVALLSYVTEILNDEDAKQYVDSIAMHWYTDLFVPPLVLDIVHAGYPEVPMLMTEACIMGLFTCKDKAVDVGSWQRGDTYAYYIIQNLQNWITGWIDWNMALNLQGGPNWAKNFVDAPIIVNNQTDEFYKQPLYYVMGHFSKFVLPGSVVIDTKLSWFASGISCVAFRTPDSAIVLIVLNSKSKDISLKINDMTFGSFQTNIPGNALQTYIWVQK